MEHPHYQVGIDLGTTYTAAAVCRGGQDARPETVALATASAAVASVVFLAHDGALLVGEPAQRRALSEPGRVVREFKRRIGDGTPLVVGGAAVPADAISARFVAWVVEEVARREGGPASTIAVTHPAEWGEHKRRSLAAALAAEGVPEALFLTEPQAAAIGYTCAERIAPGHTVAVYDLGGGTFDAAVVRKAADGSFALLGRPTGIERLGGVDFDDAIFAHVRAAIGDTWDRLDADDPAVQTAVAGLRRECTAAKETLSADTEAMIPVLLPGLHTMVRLGRAEFEDMIRPSVVETVEALRRAIVLAEVEPGELDAVLLVGGSSRIPLVSQLVSAELGRPISVDSDPKAVVAAGAALAARSVRAPGAADAADEWLAAAPARPPLDVDDLAATQGDAPEPHRRRKHALLATAVVGVAAAFTLSATAVAGLGPFTTRTVAEQTPAAPAGAVDPWTGTAIDQEEAPPGPAGETADAVTTLAGPRRPAAVAAAVRPLARNVPTGATGAARTHAVPGAVVREVGSTSVLTDRQPPVSSATTNSTKTSPAKTGETKSEPGSKTDSGTKTDPGTGTKADPGTGTNPDPGTKADPGTKTDPGTGTEPDPDTKTDPGNGADPGTGTNPDPGTRTDPDPGTKTDPGTGTNPDPGANPDGGTESSSGGASGDSAAGSTP